MKATLFKDNSMVLVIRKVRDYLGVLRDDAELTASLDNALGVEVWAGSFAPMATVGDYMAAIPPTVSVAVNDKLTGKLEGEAGGMVISVALEVTVKERK